MAAIARNAATAQTLVVMCCRISLDFSMGNGRHIFGKVLSRGGRRPHLMHAFLVNASPSSKLHIK